MGAAAFFRLDRKILSWHRLDDGNPIVANYFNTGEQANIVGRKYLGNNSSISLD